jgi:predicted DNA-binding transcriptional regulator YafY
LLGLLYFYAMNRIDRLTAILIQLQTKRVVKAEEIADRFEISLRTVYRDVKALMEAGVPIGSEAGKGYFIVDGYHLPPVMFSEEEASAMLMAGKLVEKMTDHSIRKAYESALMKIKAVLHESEKDHIENLQAVMEVRSSPAETQQQFPNHFLTAIQKALAQKEALEMEYISAYTKELTKREVEPIGMVYYRGGWHLIAWCRLRNGYRDFRADRIKDLSNTGKKFDGRNLMSLQEYFQSFLQANQDVEKVVVLFDKNFLKGRPIYGQVSETDLGDKMRLVFLSGHLQYMAHWLLMYGTAVEIEEPEKLRDMMAGLVEELHTHYARESQPL